MTHDSTNPKNILLATDLSPRSDRALDRSFYLSEKWGAKLTLVHAIEFESYHKDIPSWRREMDRKDILRARLLDSFEDEGRPAPDILIEPGKPDVITLAAAHSTEADLIVTGIAQAEPLGRKILGNTVGVLVRKAPCPVLIVKKRLPRYRRVAVGLDMSDYSKKALYYALGNFPEIEKISLVHAVSIPLRGRASDPHSYAKGLCDDARIQYEAYLDTILDAEQRARVELVIDEGGYPGWLMAKYADDCDIDLFVIGTHGESGIIGALLGRVATGILEAVPCDTLIVR